jgi:hypothetical protein
MLDISARIFTCCISSIEARTQGLGIFVCFDPVPDYLGISGSFTRKVISQRESQSGPIGRRTSYQKEWKESAGAGFCNSYVEPDQDAKESHRLVSLQTYAQLQVGSQDFTNWIGISKVSTPKHLSKME